MLLRRYDGPDTVFATPSPLVSDSLSPRCPPLSPAGAYLRLQTWDKTCRFTKYGYSKTTVTAQKFVRDQMHLNDLRGDAGHSQDWRKGSPV